MQETTLRLRVTSRDGDESYVLGDGVVVTVGRGHDNTIVLRDPRSSRQHCKIESQEGRLFVCDVGSQNGTYLNGRRIRRAPVTAGDVVQVGATRLVVESDDASTEKVAVDEATTISTELETAAERQDDKSRLSRVQEIAKRLNSDLAAERILDDIMDAAIEITGAERGFLILANRGDMEFKVARNFERETVPEPEFAVSWSIAIKVGTSGEPVLAVNASEEEGFRSFESVESLGLRSVMCVPFKVKSRILGVIYVDNRLRRGAFSEGQFRILETLADHAAVALENRRLVEELRRRAEEVEDLNSRLAERVRVKEEELCKVREELKRSGTGTVGLPGTIGESQAMREISALVRKIADTDLPVLITGESGTGKELVARAIHVLGTRRRGPFVGENCAALPETLLESELFGYKKGAFTGADRDRKGLFEQASGGTLFLDEVAEMSPTMQTKLLRVLQENEVRPLGAKDAVPLKVRLIAASNKDLRRLIAEGRFREDLFYRLKVVPITVPPLRDRRGDIRLLIDHFLSVSPRKASVDRPRLSPEVLEILLQYRWPGNVRELENEVRRMVALADGPEIGRELLSPQIVEHVELLGGTESGFHDLNQYVEAIETREIAKALRKSRGNKTKAAELLGISRFTLQRKIDKYGLEEVTEAS